jgi:hypothetical protein
VPVSNLAHKMLISSDIYKKAFFVKWSHLFLVNKDELDDLDDDHLGDPNDDGYMFEQATDNVWALYSNKREYMASFLKRACVPRLSDIERWRTKEYTPAWDLPAMLWRSEHCTPTQEGHFLELYSRVHLWPQYARFVDHDERERCLTVSELLQVCTGWFREGDFFPNHNNALVSL